MLYLVLGERINGELEKHLLIAVTEEDLKIIEPAIQRILRNGLNPDFGIQVVRGEDEKSSKDSQR